MNKRVVKMIYFMFILCFAGSMVFFNGYTAAASPTSMIDLKIPTKSPAVVILHFGHYYDIIDRAGRVWEWGEDTEFNFETKKTEIVKIEPYEAGIGEVESIESNGELIVALKKDGTAWMWGGIPYDASNGNTLSTYEDYEPAKIEGFEDIVSVSVGMNHVLGLKKDGTVVAWGHNEEGQLGDGTTKNTYDKAVKVENLTDVLEIHAGYDDSIVLKKDGSLWQWGIFEDSPYSGVKNSSIPVNMDKFPPVTHVFRRPDSGEDEVLVASDTEGSIWFYGPLQGYWYKPVRLKKYDGMVQFINKYFLKNDGTVWQWEFLTYVDEPSRITYVGRGSAAIKITSPKQVEGLSDIAYIANDGPRYIALKKDGTVITWESSKDWVNEEGFEDKSIIPKETLKNLTTHSIKAGLMSLGIVTPPEIKVIRETDVVITGYSYVDGIVKVYVNGKMIASGSTKLDGTFSIPIQKLKLGTSVTATAEDSLGNVSAAATINVCDGIPPIQPKVNKVSSADKIIKGTTEPLAKILIKRNGEIYAAGNADNKGVFNIFIVQETAGTVFEVIAIDASGNESAASKIVVYKK